jgi:hypothetical protein
MKSKVVAGAADGLLKAIAEIPSGGRYKGRCKFTSSACAPRRYWSSRWR